VLRIVSGGGGRGGIGRGVLLERRPEVRAQVRFLVSSPLGRQVLLNLLLHLSLP
jgi:hypothetical protein